MRKTDKNKIFLMFFGLEGVFFLLVNLAFFLSRSAVNNMVGWAILLAQAAVLGLLIWGLQKVRTPATRGLILNENNVVKLFISSQLFILSVFFWTIFLLFTKQVYLIYYQSTELNRLILNFILFLAVLELELFIGLPVYFADKSFHFKLNRLSTSLEFLKRPGKATIFTFVLIAIPVLIITLTGAGIDPDNINIIDLGVPLLESQIVYGVGLIFLMMWMDFGYGAKWFFNPPNDSGDQKWLEVFIFFALWAVTFLVWNSQEIPIYNNFVIGNIPPNYEIFPYSDAKSYDKNAILMMLGSGQGRVFTRVLYVFFLSLAHSIVGFDYPKVILFQTLFLSLIPPILYLVGKEIHSKGAGIVIALFALLRELNSIQAGNLTTVSNSKLLLSDVPTLLVVSIIALTLVRWVKRQSLRPIHSILLGGWLGVGILLRTQVGILIPIVLIICLAVFWGRWDQFLKKTVWIMVGVFLVVSPVLIRNYQVNGAVGFDESGYLAVNLSRFDPTGKYFNPSLTSSGVEIYKELLQFIISHPGVVLGFTINHFLRNLLSTFYIFPVRFEQISSWKDLFYITSPFWKEVNLHNGVINTFFIVQNLLIFFIGVRISQKKQWLPTLSLLGVYIFYIFSSSLGRFSGWRFVLSVDWIGYTFFVIGITEIFLIFLRPFSTPSVKNPSTGRTGAILQDKLIYLQLAIVLLMGWGSLIQEQFRAGPDIQAGKEPLCLTMLKSLETHSIETDASERFLEYCVDEAAIVKQGIGVYPEYFKRNTGYSDAGEKRDLEATKDFSRFIFVLFSEGQTNVYVKTDKKIPYFPNGGEVVVLGKKSNHGFEADAVFFGEDYQDVIAADRFDFAIDLREAQ